MTHRALLGALLAALLTALVVVAAIPAPASAGASQQSIFQEDDYLLRADDEGRERTLDELQALGVDSIHTLVGWSSIAPDAESTRRPSFDATDPAAYPAHHFDPYDGLLRSAQARGMSVIFTVNGFAPAWASDCGGTVAERRRCSPDVAEFQRLVIALARRYSGSYSDENGGGPLPRVTRWSVYNEPNQGGWLTPQWSRRSGTMVPEAPQRYRRLFQATTRALDATGHGDDTVLFGETAPLGRTSGSWTTRSLAPLRFLREAMCLDAHWRPFSGRDARLRGCHSREVFDVAGYAHHPYTRAASSDPAGSVATNDVTVSTLTRLRIGLDRAARAGRIPRDIPILLTEHGFQTDPPDSRAGTTLRRQARWLNYSDWMAYRQSRVKGVSQYQLFDEPNLAGFQTGLRFHSGTAKPSLAAYRLPVWVSRYGSRGTRVWGQARPAPRAGGGPVEIQLASRTGDFRTLTTVTPNARGFVHVKLARRASRWRLRWTAPSGEQFTSRSARESDGL